MNELAFQSLRRQVDALAADVGRLRMRAENDAQLARFVYLADRIAGHVEQIYSQLHPTAAQIVGCTFPGDSETITVVLQEVDERAARLRYTLGYRETA